MCNQPRGTLVSTAPGFLHRCSALHVCFVSNPTEGQGVSANARALKCSRAAGRQPERDVQVQPQEFVREKKGLYALSLRSSGTCSNPPLCRLVGCCRTKESILCISGDAAEVSGPSPRLRCSRAVIRFVSCGILIESEAFQINPETPGLHARAPSKSKGSQRCHIYPENPGACRAPRTPPWRPL